MDCNSLTSNSFERYSKMIIHSYIYCLLKSFPIRCETWTTKRQQMAKMNKQVPEERMGTSKLNHIFLKIYQYDPTSKYQE